MTAREPESALLARCAAVARTLAQSARDQREANVFRLTAMIVRSRFPSESQCLMQASERYFAAHPDKNWRQPRSSETVGCQACPACAIC